MTDLPASAIQHGGDHYTKRVIQPFRMSLANGYDGACHSILKYVTRFEDKGTGVLDLQKAEHIAMIRAEELTRMPDSIVHARTMISPTTYCNANKIDDSLQRQIIYLNHAWAVHGVLPGLEGSGITTSARRIASLIESLRVEKYGEES